MTWRVLGEGGCVGVGDDMWRVLGRVRVWVRVGEGEDV